MGSSERYYSSVITVLYFGATILLQNLVSSRDLHQEVACYRDRLRINCGDHSFIAIHEAFFTTRVRDNTTCGPSAIEHEHLIHHEDEEEEESTSTDPTEVSSGCSEDIRVSINRKCSGSRSCNYSYHDQSDKKCPNMRGQYVVRYDCVRNSSVAKYCNTKLESREGYFSSPGFPQFYPHLAQCGWTISSSEGQIIHLKILHLHLRPATEVVPTVSDLDSLYALGILSRMVSEEDTKCDMDSLTIMDSGIKRASVCGQSVSGLKAFEIDSGEAEISFRSAAFYPASGFLMYYKIQGCPALSSPDGSSHQLEGNSSVSIYACEGDRVFNDTLESERYLSCVRDHHWNDTLPPCILVEDVAPTLKVVATNETAEEQQQEENSTLPNAERTTAEAKQAAYLEDIIIPSVLIGVLLVVNVIIVTTILIIRRRQKASLILEDENFEDPKSEPLVADVKDV